MKRTLKERIQLKRDQIRHTFQYGKGASDPRIQEHLLGICDLMLELEQRFPLNHGENHEGDSILEGTKERGPSL